MPEIVFKDISFVGSFPSEAKCPKTQKPEFAFIGRSNVGKSSLINMLTGRKDLAKVSKTPGKTQMINIFDIEKQWNLVDLPGYGYAKLSKKHRRSLWTMIMRYLQLRPNLMTAFVLLDSRHSLQNVDLEFINELGASQIPFNIVYTKLDKVKKSQVKTNLSNIQNELLQYWDELPRQFASSSQSGEGREELLRHILGLLTTS